MKSMGDKTPPCLTPLETEKFSERVLFQRTEEFWSLYQEKSNLIIVGGWFFSSNLLNNVELHTSRYDVALQLNVRIHNASATVVANPGNLGELSSWGESQALGSDILVAYKHQYTTTDWQPHYEPANLLQCTGIAHAQKLT